MNLSSKRYFGGLELIENSVESYYKSRSYRIFKRPEGDGFNFTVKGEGIDGPTIIKLSKTIYPDESSAEKAARDFLDKLPKVK